MNIALGALLRVEEGSNIMVFPKTQMPAITTCPAITS